MTGRNVITKVDAGNSAFQRAFKGLKPDVLKEARLAIGTLIMVDVEAPPAKLHLHPLTGKTVPAVLDAKKRIKVYTFHLTSNDSYKASFTFENGTAYLRTCGPHDKIDSNP
jgi:hypothetical protein